MSKFEQFLVEQNEQKRNSSEFDAPERIQMFQNYIEELYSLIDNDWLKPYLENDMVKTGLAPISITEDSLGIYTVNAKWIELGTKRISLTPIGTELIGTKARIDISYQTKEFMIIRVGENVESISDVIIPLTSNMAIQYSKSGKSVWKYIRQNKRTSYVTLNATTFQELIMELVDEKG